MGRDGQGQGAGPAAASPAPVLRRSGESHDAAAAVVGRQLRQLQ